MKLVDKNTHETVEEMLKAYPETQDSDTYLTALIWFKELMKMGWAREDAVKFCKVLKDGKLSHPENISRIRRHIQKNKIELRGKTYDKRQNKSNKIKREIVKL